MTRQTKWSYRATTSDGVVHKVRCESYRKALLNRASDVEANINCSEIFWCGCHDDYVCSECIATAEPQMSGPAPRLMFGIKQVKCECGADKLKLPAHSDWCPKWKK